jgi:hypothetical protein
LVPELLLEPVDVVALTEAPGLFELDWLPVDVVAPLDPPEPPALV